MTTTLDMSPLGQLTSERLYDLCQNNPDLNLERSPQGQLIIMAPVGGESGRQEATLIARVVAWNDQTQLGVVGTEHPSHTLSRDRSDKPT